MQDFSVSPPRRLREDAMSRERVVVLHACASRRVRVWGEGGMEGCFQPTEKARHEQCNRRQDVGGGRWEEGGDGR